MEREADTFTTQNDRSEAQIASPANHFTDSVNLSSPQTNNAVRDMERAGKQSSQNILSSWNDFQITTTSKSADTDPMTQTDCASGTGSPGSGSCTSGLKATTESSAVAAAAAAAAGSQRETNPQLEPQPAQAPQQNQWHPENRWRLFRRSR